MPSLLRHLMLFGVAVPASLVGYHLYAGAHGSEGPPEVSSLTQAVGRFASGGGYRLSDLRLFEKDMWYVETRYVEPERLDPEAMFQHSLDAVEREVPEVLFQREPKGKRLQISVGAFSTVLVLDPIDSFQAMHSQLQRVAEVLQEHLSDDVKMPEVEYALVNGALSTLDPHTVLMPPVQAKEMGVDNDGEFGGLGISISIEDGHLTVKEPMEGTPAFRTLQADDQIVRIEGESTINMDLEDAVSKLRGPVGKPVTISVMRQGFEAPRDFTIVRETIKLNPVEGQVLPGGIVYLRIKNFNQNVDSDIEALLAKFTPQVGTVKGVVLDLRSNPGGYLNQAVDVSNRFVTDGVIVSTVEGGKNGRRDTRQATAAGTEPNYPMVVLVNGSSASASEIVAGALRNLDRAAIIGERTFGKGSVQHLYENDDESQLKLTVAKYLTPGDQSIQSVGIPPDILLQPTVVRAPSKAGESPLISLYWREWVSHESDLDHHLEQVAKADSAPAFTVRYLRPEANDDSTSSVNKVDVSKDWEVQFSREVLLAAKSARRADVVASAAGVVAKHQAEEAAKIVSAFKGQGIDWTPGTNPAAPKLSVKVDLGADGMLVAGDEENVVLNVTNDGDAPIYQLSAVTKSDNPWLDEREFYLGRIDPGQTRHFAQKVALPDGYGTEMAPLTLTFRDPDHAKLLSTTEMVHTEGKQLPAFSYTLTLKDDGSGKSKGNGDGLPQVGETVDLVVTVTNIGTGPTREAFVRLKNHAGKALDIEKGILEIGDPRDAAGKPCKPEADGCSRRLDPGATFTDRLSFDLREPPEEGAWDVELSLGDNKAYDYASVQRGGFYSYFQLTEDLKLKPGEAVDPRARQEPVISLTRRPDVEVNSPHAVLSGKVTDPRGLRDVMVFRGDQKIFYQGGSPGLNELPFSVNQDLAPGTSLFVILARNRDGLTATHGFSTWYDAPGAQVAADPIKGEAEGTNLLTTHPSGKN